MPEGILARVARALTGQGESRVLDKQQFLASGLDGFFRDSETNSGANVTPYTSLHLPVVYSCVNLIADMVSQLPLDVVRETKGDPNREPLDRPTWLVSMSGTQLPVSFKHMMLVSVLLTGNAYAAVHRDPQTFRILGMEMYHPERVEPFIDKDGIKKYRIDGIGDAANGFGGFEGTVLIDSLDMIHVPGFVMPGEIKGLSPIGLAREAIGLGMTAEKFGAKFFRDGAHVSGIIEAEKGLDADAARAMARTFQRNHGGTDRSHLPGVLTNGAKWKPISVPPNEAQFLETRRFQKTDIALLYRVPAYMVDPAVTSSWGTGITEQNRAFVTYTLSPWIIRVEQALTQLVPRGQSVKFNMDALLRGTTRERYATYAIGLGSGFLCVDDVRAWEDMQALPDGQGQVFAPVQPAEPGVSFITPANPQAPHPGPGAAPKSGNNG